MVGRAAHGRSKCERHADQGHAGGNAVRAVRYGRRPGRQPGSGTGGERALPLPGAERRPLPGRTLPERNETGYRRRRDDERHLAPARANRQVLNPACAPLRRQGRGVDFERACRAERERGCLRASRAAHQEDRRRGPGGRQSAEDGMAQGTTP